MRYKKKSEEENREHYIKKHIKRIKRLKEMRKKSAPVMGEINLFDFNEEEEERWMTKREENIYENKI